MADASFTKVAFYIVAHADDWQLFMQPNTYEDLVAPDKKVVFIITTAGEAGKEARYWRAREEGCKSSIRFCLAPRCVLAETSGTKELNHHVINYASINNATCYFMRLPDGGLDGSGFATYQHQSLSKFKNEVINPMAAVDQSTTYSNWTDLYQTLQAIILSESVGTEVLSIHYINPNTSVNPNDHADHIATGQLVQAMAIITNLPQVLFTGYHSKNTLQQLSETAYFWKAGMFAAYEKAVFDGYSYSTLREDINIYLQWCARGASFVTINQ